MSVLYGTKSPRQLAPLLPRTDPQPVAKPVVPKVVPVAKAPQKVARDEPEKEPEPPAKPAPKAVKKTEPSSNYDLVGPKPRTFETLMNNAN